MSATEVTVRMTVNGEPVERLVDVRTTMSDFLRGDLGLTGTHVGCEQGACGACTVLVDGRAVRSCLLLAVMAEGAAVRTVESLVGPSGEMSPLQEAFLEHGAAQCGFCTPGFLMLIEELLADPALDLDRAGVRTCVASNLCRCTGYNPIIAAVTAVAAARENGGP